MVFSPELLREAMGLAGLTAANLAKRSGLHRVSVSNFVRGLPPSEESWAKIARALKVAMAEHGRAVEKMRKRLAA